MRVGVGVGKRLSSKWVTRCTSLLLHSLTSRGLQLTAHARLAQLLLLVGSAGLGVEAELLVVHVLVGDGRTHGRRVWKHRDEMAGWWSVAGVKLARVS